MVKATSDAKTRTPTGGLGTGYSIMLLPIVFACGFAAASLVQWNQCDGARSRPSSSPIANEILNESFYATPKMVSIMPPEIAQPLLLDSKSRRALAKSYFKKAGTFNQQTDKGSIQTWMHVLAARSIDDEGYLDWVVKMYVEKSRPPAVDIAMDHVYQTMQRLLRRKEGGEDTPRLKKNLRAAKKLLATLKKKHPAKWKKYQRIATEEAQTVSIPPAQVLVPFAQLCGQWDLLQSMPKLDQLHQDFYTATMEAYNEMRRGVRGRITDTELNNKFYNWQMNKLDQTGEHWSGYTKIPLFHSLLASMHQAATEFLMMHGFSRDSARRKAAHHTIFWTSVHSGSSIHHAHVAEDSLIGGVYYASVPPNSGNLQLLDPRGVNTLTVGIAAKKQLKTAPQPPFHRTIDITPRPGLLVLFPGWLTHRVLPSRGLDESKSGYRISVSLNLKGEWQDTTSLTLSLKDHVISTGRGSDQS